MPFPVVTMTHDDNMWHLYSTPGIQMSPEQHRQPGRAVAIVNFLQFAMEHGLFVKVRT